MPRRNKKSRKKPRYLLDHEKPKGMKRPRGWHRGQNRDAEFLAAQQRLEDAA